MKIVTGSIVVSALMVGVAGAAYAQSGAQSGDLGASGMNGAQSGGANSTGVAAGTSLGAGASPMPGGATAMGGTGNARSGPVLNNMRANGTSLNMSPDPRAPNLAGKTPPPR